MLLNTDKTKAILIAASQKLLHLHNDVLHITYNNDVLNSVENEKVLGVRIDNNLTWSIHSILLLKIFFKYMAIVQIEGLFVH